MAEEPVPKASGWYCDVHPGTEIAWLVPEGNPIKVNTHTRQLTWLGSELAVARLLAGLTHLSCGVV